MAGSLQQQDASNAAAGEPLRGRPPFPPRTAAACAGAWRVGIASGAGGAADPSEPPPSTRLEDDPAEFDDRWWEDPSPQEQPGEAALGADPAPGAGGPLPAEALELGGTANLLCAAHWELGSGAAGGLGPASPHGSERLAQAAALARWMRPAPLTQHLPCAASEQQA